MHDEKNRLSIPVEDFPSNPVFIGEKSRLSSATSVSFLSEDTIACAHFSSQKIYAYAFDLHKRSCELISVLDTTYRGKKCSTDLMAFDGFGRIAVSNFLEKTCTLYKYDGLEIQFAHDVPFIAGDVVHGIKFFSDDILAMTSRRREAGVDFFRVLDGNLVFSIKSDRHSVQDVCFLSQNKLVMISTTNSPKLYPQEMWSSHIDIIEFDIDGARARILYSLELKDAHIDNVVKFDGFLYVSDQYNDSVIVFDQDNLQLRGKYEGFYFPHGLDVRNGLLAVSNYGSNTIEIRRL